MIYDSEVATLADLARVQSRRFAERAALTCEGSTWTYAQLAERCADYVTALLDLGLTPGQRVALLSKESNELVAALLAVAECGAVVVPINWRLSAVEVGFLTNDAECVLLCASAEFLPLTAQVPAACRVIRLGEAAPPRGGSHRSPAQPVDRRQVAAQLYTSGTTGRPKGVLLPHDSFFAIAREYQLRGETFMEWSGDEVTLCALPSFHIGGLWWLIRGLASGAHNVLLPQFIGWKAIDAIAQHRVTKAALVPAMMQVMLGEPNAHPEAFQSLVVVGYGGSPIAPALQARAAAVFGCQLYQVYGLTETGNMAVSLSPNDHQAPERLASAGKPLAGVSLKIVDAAGNELAAGSTGEVCIKSPAAMLGYWKQPEATADTLQDGWVRTGDAGHLDRDGYLFISDRIKDMICCAGEKIWPAEVEAVLAAHPAVREIAIIGVPHAEWGEATKAVVIAHPQTTLSLRELRAFGQNALASFKLPSSLELVESLPRTASGKIQKKALREAHWAAEHRQVG